jgi:RNA polymerase sigma-70 factor (ECF subfamily)
MNEETAINLAREGHEDAFRYLYDTNRERVYALAYRYTRSRHDAEDIMQETFTKAFRKIDSFGTGQGSSFSAWVARICINSAIQQLRWQKRRKMDRVISLADMKQEIASGEASPEDCAADRERQELLERALGKLSPAQRVIFDLRYSRHLALKEIAEYTGSSMSNVKTQLHRSMHKLKKEMEPLWTEQ